MIELKEFFQYVTKKYNDTIAYCIHLGDFWKGRNVILGEKTYTFWKNPSFLDDLPFPLFSLKGNEDINIPEAWWEQGMISLLPHLQIFNLNGFKTIPIHYIENTKKQLESLGIEKIIRLKKNKNIAKNNQSKNYKNKKFVPIFDYEETTIPKENSNQSQSLSIPINNKYNVLKDNTPIDFIFSHTPPFGLLDKTRDAITHKEIRFTGNRLVRLIIDKRNPKVVFFGHNHHSNYMKFGDLFVIACDKLIRKSSEFLFKNPNFNNTYNNNKLNNNKIKNITQENDKTLYNYVLIEILPNITYIKMIKRNKLVLVYDLNSEKIILSKLKKT